MPTLNISREELGSHRGRATLGYLESIMLWPGDTASQQHTDAAIMAQRMRDAIPDEPDGIDWLTSGQLKNLLGFVADAPRLSDIRSDGRKPYFRGVITGLILVGVIHRRDAGHKRAQLNDMMATVVQAMSGAGGFTLAHKTINNDIWPRFRCVAHLWAAHLWAAATSGEGAFPCRLDRIADFLSVAEWYRLEGEGWRPKQSDRTVLSAAETWRMPDNTVNKAVPERLGKDSSL